MLQCKRPAGPCRCLLGFLISSVLVMNYFVILRSSGREKARRGLFSCFIPSRIIKHSILCRHSFVLMPSWLVSAPFASPRQELLQWAVQQVGQNCKQFGCHETTLEVGTTSTRATQSTLYQKDLIKKRMQTIPGEGEEHVNGYICSVYIYICMYVLYMYAWSISVISTKSSSSLISLCLPLSARWVSPFVASKRLRPQPPMEQWRKSWVSSPQMWFGPSVIGGSITMKRSLEHGVLLCYT